MYEAVQAMPAGPSTVGRLALTAADLGYDGIVLRDPDRVDRPGVETIAERYDVDIVRGIELHGESPDVISGALTSAREAYTILAVRGGSDRVNRFAVNQERVDVLARPLADDGRVNHVLVKRAAANDVCFEVSLDRILRSSGGDRVRAIAGLRRLRRLLDTYGAPYVVSAAASSHLHLRGPRDLFALGDSLGLDSDWLAAGLETWRRLADRNRHRQSGEYVAPGVRRLGPEAPSDEGP